MAELATSTHKVANAVTDPVCRMEVYPGRTRLATIHQGQSYWFCSEECRLAFEMNPRKYLNLKGARRKGWFSRYLERMAKINKKEFGGCPKCH